jgi:hypothetical protein
MLVTLPAHRAKVAVGRANQSTSIPAPVGGWNAMDSIAAMPETDAVVMDNLFPSTSYVELRKGHSLWWGFASGIETLMQYRSGTVSKLFAAASNGVYDVTVSANDPSPTAEHAISNGRLQYVNFGNAAGQFLYFVNGVNPPTHFNGSVWVAPALTGIANPNTLIHINVFKSRLYFIENNTMRFWYLPVNAISGALTSFELGSLFTRGGSLMAMGTWTIDGGSGVDDLAVFITTEGEVAVYKGSDPSSATNWALVGVYRIGRPIGRRCFLKMGSDLLIICVDGVIGLSKALVSSEGNGQASITYKIREAFSASAREYFTNFGWQGTLFPTQNMLLFNIPIRASVGLPTQSHQYVMNTLTGAWSRFTGWDATCFELFGNELYFSNGGAVFKAWDGANDNNEPIVAKASQAYSYFGTPGINKRWTLVRPVIFTDGPLSLSLNINVNFVEKPLSSIFSLGDQAGALWDVATWDVDEWGGTETIQETWRGVTALGYSGGLGMQFSSSGISMRWASTDFIYETGWQL